MASNTQTNANDNQNDLIIGEQVLATTSTQSNIVTTATASYIKDSTTNSSNEIPNDNEDKITYLTFGFRNPQFEG